MLSLRSFWLVLDGDGLLPVMHLGMTGALLLQGGSQMALSRGDGLTTAPSAPSDLGAGRVLVKDQPGLEYQEGSKDSGEWPPRVRQLSFPDGSGCALADLASRPCLQFMKFVLHFEDGTEIAFADPRRLGRIRLRADPLNEPPISQVRCSPPRSKVSTDAPFLETPPTQLGPDPIHAPPSTEDWHASVSHRRTNIKSVLLDQSVCAGVGNWVADEILFHARLHPMTVASTLSEEEIERVRVKMLYVVNTAVGVGADAKKFPGGWLMRHRWGKGKKKGEGEQFLLEDGTPAQVEFISVRPTPYRLSGPARLTPWIVFIMTDRRSNGCLCHCPPTCPFLHHLQTKTLHLQTPQEIHTETLPISQARLLLAIAPASDEHTIAEGSSILQRPSPSRAEDGQTDQEVAAALIFLLF